MITQSTRWLFTLFLFTAITLNAHAEAAKKNVFHKLTFVEQQLEISVEIVSTREQRERGLMFRTHLEKNHGMLFSYTDEAPRRIWMKNTLIPLDILFFSKTGQIIAMLPNLQPCQTDPCPIYDSEVSAMYMLEVSAGFIETNHLNIGHTLRLPQNKSNTS